MSDYMKNQGLVDSITGCRNRQRELEAEIERLRAVVDAANNLFCWGMGIEGKQSYAKITEQSWEPFEKALAALEDV